MEEQRPLIASAVNDGGKEDMEMEPGVMATLSKASRTIKVLLASSLLFQTLFTLSFFYSSDVSDLPVWAVVVACLSAVGFLACIGVSMWLSHVYGGPIRPGLAGLFYVCSFTFAVLFGNWFRYFVQGIVAKIHDHDVPVTDERVLSGFIVLLVYSSDVHGALNHVSEFKSFTLLRFLPLCLLSLALAVVAIMFRVFGDVESAIVGDPLLLLENTLTLLICVLHLTVTLQAGDSPHPPLPPLGILLTAGFMLLCTAAMVAVMGLAFSFEYLYIADIIHRCIDVALLLEAQVVRQFQLKYRTRPPPPTDDSEPLH